MMIFYKSHPNLQLYKEKVFFVILCIITFSLVCDVASLYVIRYRDRFSPSLVDFVCKSYVITLVCGSWSALIYVLADLVTIVKHRIITFWLLLALAIQSVLVYLLPIYIYDRDNQAYTYGPSITLVYVFVAIYILSILTITMVFRKKLNPHRRFATNLWMLIWIVAAITQFINSKLLLVGFASALGVLILFTIIENPEANLDRRLDCFNSYALSEYLKQQYENHRPFCLLDISFENEKFLEERGIDINAIFQATLRLCGKDILAFKNINLGLVLVSESSQKLERTGQAILDKFSPSDIFRNNALMTLIRESDAFSDEEELYRFLTFVRAEYQEEKGDLLIADKEMISRFQMKFSIEREITLALIEDRVEVFLQPIYSAKENRFTSAEALIRIRKPDGELLPPSLFIPIAESNGQILALGERVFEKICAFLKDSDAIKLGLEYVEINLSVVQCEKENLSDSLISIIEKYQIDPKRINLEITETASIRARMTLLDNMEKLIAYGFTFSLDDFGKGESNLMYMVEMPVSIVKLDYDMSKAFFDNEKAKQVVHAVVGMSHGMGLKVVAEGIETLEEREQIMREGVDYIQGFYYAKPLPIEEFLDFLKNLQ